MCGSDGKTYLNDCVMKAKACEKDMDIYVVLDGYCGKLPLAFSEFQNSHFQNETKCKTFLLKINFIRMRLNISFSC